jgi:hypothetical protein
VLKKANSCDSFLCVTRGILRDPLWFNDLKFTTKGTMGFAKVHKGLFNRLSLIYYIAFGSFFLKKSTFFFTGKSDKQLTLASFN